MTQHNADWAIMVESDLGRAAARHADFGSDLPGFVFLRHGRTSSNVTGTIQGQLDIGLDAVGCAQAVEAGRLLRHAGVERFVASDLSRAFSTAHFAAQELGLPPPAADARLRERAFGVLQGQKGIEGAWLSTEPTVETSEAFVTRTLEGVRAAADPATVICAHGGNLRVIAVALGLSLDASCYANAHPLRFGRSRRGWYCESLRAERAA